MKSLTQLIDLQGADFDKKRGNLALTTLVSLVGLATVIVVEALVVKEETEDDSEVTE